MSLWFLIYILYDVLFIPGLIHVLLASAWLHWPGWMGLEGEGEAGGLGYLASPSP